MAGWGMSFSFNCECRGLVWLLLFDGIISHRFACLCFREFCGTSLYIFALPGPGRGRGVAGGKVHSTRECPVGIRILSIDNYKLLLSYAMVIHTALYTKHN